MQKTLDILEKNVQWLALGLGGIFLLWVVWSYVINPPATVLVDRKPFGPGDISDYTAGNPVRDIQNQIDSEKQVASIQVADVVGPWRMQMGATSPLPTLAGRFNSEVRGGDVTGTKDHPTPENPTGEIAALPQLPKAQATQSQAGLSVVQLPTKGGGGNVQNAANPSHDLAWVSETFVIPASALKAAFEAPLQGRQLPAGVYNTTLLQVVLQRQRATGLDANNQPTFPQGDQGVQDVPAPATVKDDMQQLPPESADVNQKYAYIDWAQKNQDAVSQPPFYQVMAGDPYTSPPALPPAGAPGAAQPLPLSPTPAPTPAPSTPPATAPNKNPRDLFAPRTQANFQSQFANTDDAMDRRRAERGNRGNAGIAPGLVPFGARGGNNNANPAANFNPLEIAADMQIWAHDDSVKAGETYRYRVVYKMKNPLFNTSNIATKQVSQEYLLISPPSDWTAPVAVPKSTKFWVNAYRRDGALLDIYDWVNGKWTKKSRVVSPGDQVPGTDWTLVDVRGGAVGMERDKYVLLTDDTGALVRRSVQADSGDPDYKTTEDATKAPATDTNTRPGRTAQPGRTETPDQRRQRRPGQRT